jgi:predicted GNAT family acetyltransferase
VAYISGKQVGECDFRRTEDGWVIYHTEVLPEYEGKSIAKRLVYRLLEAAEKEGMKVIPVCSYAAKVLSGK